MGRKNANARKRKATVPIEELVGPTPEQLARGGVERVSMPDPDGGNRVAIVHINRGGTPLTRWNAAGVLSDTQLLAISTCLRLWSVVGLEQRTTASYGERIPGSGNEECRAAAWLEAKDDLARIEGHFAGLKSWWQIFENVCRWDEPAGVAGSRLGLGARSAETRAHQVVCMVADYIAMKEGLLPVARIRAV